MAGASGNATRPRMLPARAAVGAGGASNTIAANAIPVVRSNITSEPEQHGDDRIAAAMHASGWTPVVLPAGTKVEMAIDPVAGDRLDAVNLRIPRGGHAIA